MSAATSATDRDYTLRSGERQVATSFDGIRADHRARYQWAARQIREAFAPASPSKPTILDAFCGVGYGAQHLAQETGALVSAIDASIESIAFARATFPHPSVDYVAAEYPCALGAGVFDVIVCFESLEHVADDAWLIAAFQRALKPNGLLFLSVPNEDVIPRATFGNPFHFRHYTRKSLFALVSAHAPALDLELHLWQSKEGDIGGSAAARTLLFQFRKISHASGIRATDTVAAA